MTGAELVSEAISYYDNTLPNDATNAARRLRVLHNAQMVVDEVYNHRPWPFKHHSCTVVTSNGVAGLPHFPAGIPATPDPIPPGYFAPDGVSFGRLGPEGMVREESTGAVWTETTLQEVAALRTTNSSQLKLFAIGSFSGPDGIVTAWDGTRWSGGLYRLIIPNTTDALTFTVHFDAAPPALADTADPIVLIPPQYHRTVLLAGTIVRMQTSKSDIRQFWLQQYAMGLGRMQANEMPLQSRVKQMPLFQRGQW
jgi:hypothetical protein